MSYICAVDETLSSIIGIMDFLSDLNKQQYEAVTNSEGASLVIAGAGSGKTRVLTMRIAYLLSKGVKPYNILALTFTNKAAREMKERISAIVGETTAQQLWMGTFHSIFARILRYEAEAVGFDSNYTIYDAQDSQSAIKSIIKEMQLDDKIYKASNVAATISQAKNDLITPSAYANNDNYLARDKAKRQHYNAEIYARYARACKKSNAMDFDDLLLYANVLFRDNADILEKYQDKFKYILVDEYQDTNYSQYIIIKRLCAKTRNICVVGDDAQSIYSFRGARIENILNFQRDYPDYKLFKLEQNYRSTQNIVNAANSLISHNINQIPKTVFSQKDEGDKVRIISAHSDIEEAKMICNDIRQRIFTENLRPEDFAILYRNNALSRPIEEELQKTRISYKVYGGLAFYQRKEIKDTLSYFRAIINRNDTESLKRVFKFPKRGIGETSVNKLISISTQNNVALRETMRPDILDFAGISKKTATNILELDALLDSLAEKADSLNAYAFAMEVMDKCGIHKALMETKDEQEGKDRYENIVALLSGLKEYCDQQEETGESALMKDYLESIALITDLDNSNKNDAHITLMTIHSSKGLEFEHVYIVGVEENLFPKQTIATNELEEERRLFYVALTRAEKSVSVSYSLSRFTHGQRTPSQPSRFICDIDEELVIRPQSMNVAEGRSLFSRPNNEPRFSFRQNTAISQQSANRRLTPLHASKSTFLKPERKTTVTTSADTFSIGDRVEHERFGYGQILEISDNGPNTKLRITFDNFGEKTLLLKFARLQKLQ